MRSRARKDYGPTVCQRTSAPALCRRVAAKTRDAPTSPRRGHHSCAVAPFAGRRSARTLGRAARLIEGPETHLFWYFLKDHVESERSVCERKRKTITLNGGSLGSWVDEERS